MFAPALLTASVLALSGPFGGPPDGDRVLVLGSALNETSQEAVLVSEELGAALASEGFTVLTVGDVRSVFRASGCALGLGQESGSIRDLPFRMMSRLHSKGVGVVYGGEAGSLDDKSWLHLMALNTGSASVVARERIEISGNTRADRKALRRAAKELQKKTRKIVGKRIFAGVGGSTDPRASRVNWQGELKSVLRAKPGFIEDRCVLPESTTHFDVVVHARRSGADIVVDGTRAGEQLFASLRVRKKNRSFRRVAREVKAALVSGP